MRPLPQPAGFPPAPIADSPHWPDPVQVAAVLQAGPGQDGLQARGLRSAPAGARVSDDEPVAASGSEQAGIAAQSSAFANLQPAPADVNLGSQDGAASESHQAPGAIQAPVTPGIRTPVQAPLSDVAEADPAVQISRSEERTQERSAHGRRTEAGAAPDQTEVSAGPAPSVDAGTPAAPSRERVLGPRSGDQMPQTEAARRVLEVVDRMGGDTAPKRVLVDLPQLGGMRLEVSMRGESVHLSLVEPGSHGDLVTFGREVAAGLADKGFELTGFGSRGGFQQGAGSWADERRQGPPPGTAWAQAQRRRGPSGPMLRI
jgi:hypothetical protein